MNVGKFGKIKPRAMTLGMSTRMRPANWVSS